MAVTSIPTVQAPRNDELVETTRNGRKTIGRLTAIQSSSAICTAGCGLNGRQSNKKFSESEYQDILNKIRKLIVYYRQKDTYFRFAWLKNLNNEEAIRKLQQEKDELSGLLKDQMKLTIDGFKSAILLINEG